MPDHPPRDPTREVHVFEPDVPTGLAFTRSLGRRGVPVRVWSAGPLSLGRLSRWAASSGRCPPPGDVDRFLPWLEDRVRSGEVRRVAPTSDMMAFYLAELAALFPPEVRAAMPERDAVLRCLFKDRFDAACREAGFETPWQWAPASVEEVRERADELEYPLVIKPRSHVGVGLDRGGVVTDAATLRRRYAAHPIGAWYRARHPELALPILQAYVPGALQNLFSISGVMDRDREAVAVSAAVKRSQWPPQLGVGTLFDVWQDELRMRRGLELVRALLGRGIFELEFIHDRRRDAWLAIDLNPRAHGHLSFDIARGADLPALWEALTRGERPAAPDVRPGGLHWINGVPWHVGEWVRLLRGPDRLARFERWWDRQRRPHVDIVHDDADPLPSLLHTARMLRHPRGLVRSFLEPMPGAEPEARQASIASMGSTVSGGRKSEAAEARR